MIVEGSSDDENENVTSRNTKKLSGRKRKFDELVEAIRSLSDIQQEKLISEIQPKRPRNSALANISGKQVLVPTGNADSQFD